MLRIWPAQEFTTRRPRLGLSGTWEFSYDPHGVGIAQKWYDADRRLPERIHLPGCPQARRYASAEGGTPAVEGRPDAGCAGLLRYPCSLDAWFKRRIRVPAEWRPLRVWLRIGGVKPAAEFWLNGRRLGATITSRSPVRADITRYVDWDCENVLTVRVHWPRRRLDGVHDWIGWSGLYRDCWIEATPRVHIDRLFVRTRIAPPSVALEMGLAGRTLPRGSRVECVVTARGGGQRFSAASPLTLAAPGSVSVPIDMPGANLWSPEAPHLYSARVRLRAGARVIDEAIVRFGLREIRTRGHHVLLNGRPIFLRGGCDDHLYPETACPPASVAFFRSRIRRAKQYGFNYTKSCVETFPDEYLQAADELGYLVCQEMPFGLVPPGPRHLRYAPPRWFSDMCRAELGNIVRSDRNHPCVVIYSMASELDGRWLRSRRCFNLFSRELPRLARALRPDALVFDCTGESGRPGTVPLRTTLGRRDADLHGSFVAAAGESYCPLEEHFSALAPVTRPFVLHEYSWITCLSDPAIVRRLHGKPIQPLHVRAMLASARRAGLARLLPAMIDRSRRLKHALRRDALEQARLHPKIAGYHHWLIHDFPFCAEGVLDEFWQPPPDLSAAEFSRCNADTVLLLEDRHQRVFSLGGPIPIGLRVSHFGAAPLPPMALRWTLHAGSRQLAGGFARLAPLRPGGTGRTPRLGIRLPPGCRPLVLRLKAELTAGGQRVNRNEWTLWALPSDPPDADWRRVRSSLPWVARALPRAGVTRGDTDPLVQVTDRLDDAALRVLSAGGRVLFVAPDNVGPGVGLPRAEGAPLYRTVPFNAGLKGNMGTVLLDHPALGGLPHDGWCDFCFAPLLNGARPFALAPFGRGRIAPIIRSIGHMRSMEDKGYLFELTVGRGHLLACSMRLRENMRRDPMAAFVLRRMTAWLLGADATPLAHISLRRFHSIRPGA